MHLRCQNLRPNALDVGKAGGSNRAPRFSVTRAAEFGRFILFFHDCSGGSSVCVVLTTPRRAINDVELIVVSAGEDSYPLSISQFISLSFTEDIFVISSISKQL